MLAGDDEMLGGPPRIASLLEVHRDHRRELALPARIQGEKRFGRELVERTTILLQQRAVRGVLYQCVAEQIFELRLHSGDLDQAARFELPEVGFRGHVVRASSRRSRIVKPNCRPITEATRRVRRLSCGRRSMRSSRRP